MLNQIVVLGGAFLLTVVVLRIIYQYRKTEGTVWQRIKSTTEYSLSVFVSYLTMIGGYVITYVGAAADSIDQSQVSGWIQSNLSAKYVGAGIVILGIVFFLARLRGLVSSFSIPTKVV